MLSLSLSFSLPCTLSKNKYNLHKTLWSHQSCPGFHFQRTVSGNTPGHAHPCLSLHWEPGICFPSLTLAAESGKAGKLALRVSLEELQAHHGSVSPCPLGGNPGETKGDSPYF